MSYHIAYGVNKSQLKNRQLIDKFIVATINNDEKVIKEILASILQTTRAIPVGIAADPVLKEVAKPQEKEPFQHLKGN